MVPYIQGLSYPTNFVPSASKILNPLNPLQKIPQILIHPLPRPLYPWRMFSLARLRKEPALAQYFAFVHPFFWLVLIWQLGRAVAQVRAAGRQGAMLRVMWWGGVRIEYLGDAQPNPSAYRPVEPTRKAWDDPCWSSAVPAFLGGEASAVIFPCFSGGSGRALSALTKGGCTLTPHPDTS